MRSFPVLVTFVVAASAFAPPARRHGLSFQHVQRNMFSPNPDDGKVASEQQTPLEIVADGENASVPAVEPATFPMGTKTMIVKNLAKGGEVKEVKFYDPAMQANTNPLQMEWWAYFFVTFPFLLLANDFLHFLPTEGPLAFLSNY